MRLTPILLPFKSSGSDAAAGDDGLSHNVLDGADEDHIGGTAHVSIDVANAAGNRHLGVAAEQRRGDNARR